jgi:hypothetical protein
MGSAVDVQLKHIWSRVMAATVGEEFCEGNDREVKIRENHRLSVAMGLGEPFAIRAQSRSHWLAVSMTNGFLPTGG